MKPNCQSHNGTTSHTHEICTVDLGIFCCKNIFEVCTSHEKKKNKKYILQRIVIAVSTFCTQFHSKASKLFHTRRLHLWYLQVTHGKRMTTFHSVSHRSITATCMCLQFLRFCFTYMQFANSHERCFVFHIFLACVVSFQITKAGNTEQI